MGVPFGWTSPTSGPTTDGQYPTVSEAALGYGGGYWVLVQGYGGGYAAGRFPSVWVASDPTGTWTKVTTPGYPGVPPGTNSTTFTQTNNFVGYDGTYFAFATAGNNTGAWGFPLSVIVYGSASSPYSDWSTLDVRSLLGGDSYTALNIRYTGGYWIMTGTGYSAGPGNNGWIAYSTDLLGPYTVVDAAGLGVTYIEPYDAIYYDGYYYLSGEGTGGITEGPYITKYASSPSGPWTSISALHGFTTPVASPNHFATYIVANGQLFLKFRRQASNWPDYAVPLRLANASPPTTWTTIGAKAALDYAVPPNAVSPYWISSNGVYDSLTGPNFDSVESSYFAILSNGTHTVAATGLAWVLGPRSFYPTGDTVGTLSHTSPIVSEFAFGPDSLTVPPYSHRITLP